MDPNFIEKSLGLMDTPEGQAQIESNTTLYTILAYYLYTEEKYNQLF
jgi:hypothetical protein